VTLWEDEVHKLFSVGIAIAVSLICVAAAQSMPLASLEQTQTSIDGTGSELEETRDVAAIDAPAFVDVFEMGDLFD
jgi:hypothetical protein